MNVKFHLEQKGHFPEVVLEEQTMLYNTSNTHPKAERNLSICICTRTIDLVNKHSFVTTKILPSQERSTISLLLFIWNNINHAPDNQFMKQFYYCILLFLVKIYVESTNTGKKTESTKNIAKQQLTKDEVPRGFIVMVNPAVPCCLYLIGMHLQCSAF